MTPEEIAADRAVIDAATGGPGPWTAPGYEVWAAFIAAARTGWPRALAALEAALIEQTRLINESSAWLAGHDAARVQFSAERDEALAEVERLRASLIDANVEVERLRRDKVEITVSRGIDPKDPEGVTLRIEGSGEAWDFHVTDFTRYTTPPKWDVSRRAESAEAQVTALRERIAELEGQLAMRGTP